MKYICNKVNKNIENFLSIREPTQIRMIGGCAGTRYGCDSNGQPVTAPIPTETPEIPIRIGGCAGTRYGCNSNGQPATEKELEEKILIESRIANAANQAALRKKWEETRDQQVEQPTNLTPEEQCRNDIIKENAKLELEIKRSNSLPQPTKIFTEPINSDCVYVNPNFRNPDIHCDVNGNKGLMYMTRGHWVCPEVSLGGDVAEMPIGGELARRRQELFQDQW